MAAKVAAAFILLLSGALAQTPKSCADYPMPSILDLQRINFGNGFVTTTNMTCGDGHGLNVANYASFIPPQSGKYFIRAWSSPVDITIEVRDMSKTTLCNSAPRLACNDDLPYPSGASSITASGFNGLYLEAGTNYLILISLYGDRDPGLSGCSTTSGPYNDYQASTMPFELGFCGDSCYPDPPGNLGPGPTMCNCPACGSSWNSGATSAPAPLSCLTNHIDIPSVGSATQLLSKKFSLESLFAPCSVCSKYGCHTFEGRYLSFTAPQSGNFAVKMLNEHQLGYSIISVSAADCLQVLACDVSVAHFDGRSTLGYESIALVGGQSYVVKVAPYAIQDWDSMGDVEVSFCGSHCLQNANIAVIGQLAAPLVLAGIFLALSIFVTAVDRTIDKRLVFIALNSLFIIFSAWSVPWGCAAYFFALGILLALSSHTHSSSMLQVGLPCAVALLLNCGAILAQVILQFRWLNSACQGPNCTEYYILPGYGIVALVCSILAATETIYYARSFLPKEIKTFRRPFQPPPKVVDQQAQAPTMPTPPLGRQNSWFDRSVGRLRLQGIPVATQASNTQEDVPVAEEVPSATESRALALN